MEINNILLEQLQAYGVGRRKLDDKIFTNDKPPPRFGICDVDDENLCHQVVKTPCHIPGCKYVAESLLEYETHYASHRYSCSQCKKVLPSPHLLDLHIQEQHDSFFAVMAARNPSYCCYIEDCKEKFPNPEERLNHCVEVHKLPKDFRFDQKPKAQKTKKKTKNKNIPMDLESSSSSSTSLQKFNFTNSKSKGFAKYSGKVFTKNNTDTDSSIDVNMDDVVKDLKESLPK